MASDARRTPTPDAVTQIGRQMPQAASGRTQAAVACIGSDQELEAGPAVALYMWWSPQTRPRPRPTRTAWVLGPRVDAVRVGTAAAPWAGSGPRVEKRRT
ncbi:hypothetical protein GGTG_10899 [Gaeumannomyces tritici R3-111a-1]|uniref:Uncharacterized protein n=1 Tax=Gaeumannomyces tritici (strain R3-111a-1) TaxID=644352 RepID=J3PBM7_GAET3|nr:hypothetical protein GGTG_10899 [Gaeumannomyces tritici R3-111a-1]EJT71644.1 hypothetical protein GGTG_10899 [Gaeumannomyces tritici R3-111a-1]